MSKAKSEMRPEYRREDLGKGTRGKYFARFEKGTNLVLLSDEVAKAFPTAAAVNEALSGLLTLARKTASAGGRTRAPRKRLAG
jgi:hypothetical protein